MAQLEIAVKRPERWDTPFGPSMSDDEVRRLLAIEPFASMNPADFPAGVPLEGILRNDTRIVDYSDGSIIVREGDYGNSAFLVLSGRVKIVLEGLDDALLGRPEKPKQGAWNSLLKLLKNPSLPEVRKRVPRPKQAEDPSQDGATDPSQRKIFLQDFPRLMYGSSTLSLHSGEIFGELAAMTRMPRAGTAIADGQTQLLEIRWQGLRDLMRRTESLQKHIEHLYRESSLHVHLRETPLLSQLSNAELDAVADATVFETHGNFEWQAAFDAAAKKAPADAIVNEPLIAEEGLPSDSIVLIRAGFARLSHRHGHGHRTVAYLGKGQVYGLSEAIQSIRTGQAARSVNSLRALGYVDVLRIPLEVLKRFVIPNVSEQALDDLANKHAVYCSNHHCDVSTDNLGKEPADIDPSLLEFLVEERLINGREAMVIDLDRCTRCDDCVRACAATHDNNPRFIRHGEQHGKFMIAHACMHCVDPVCMIGCPTGAIARDTADGTVRINDFTCIGCSVCANSCPYDNIRMVEIRDRGGAIMIDENSRQPILKATKCDLCADQPTGPACQRACPHDALVRIDLGNLGELSQWVSR